MLTQEDVSTLLNCMNVACHESQLEGEENDRLAVILKRIAANPEATPIPMQLPCPKCHELHIDEGEFATRPHHTHSCQNCGLTWRPAVVATVGVRFLPGFKNADVEQDWSRVLPHQLRVACCRCSTDTNAPGTYDWTYLNGKWYCADHVPPAPR